MRHATLRETLVIREGKNKEREGERTEGGKEEGGEEERKRGRGREGGKGREGGREGEGEEGGGRERKRLTATLVILSSLLTAYYRMNMITDSSPNILTCNDLNNTNFSSNCFCMLSSNLSNCSVVGGVVTHPLTCPLTSDGNSGHSRDEWELWCEWTFLNRRRK